MARPKPETILAFLEKSLQPSAGGGGGGEQSLGWGRARYPCRFLHFQPLSALLSELAGPSALPALAAHPVQSGSILSVPNCQPGVQGPVSAKSAPPRHPPSVSPVRPAVPSSLSLSILTEHSPVTAVWWVRGGGKSRRWGQATTSGQFSDAQSGRRGDGCRM